MDGGVVTFILAILIVAVLIFVAILLTGKRNYIFNKEVYQAKFLSIENKLNQNNAATFMTTVIEADQPEFSVRIVCRSAKRTTTQYTTARILCSN